MFLVTGEGKGNADAHFSMVSQCEKMWWVRADLPTGRPAGRRGRRGHRFVDGAPDGARNMLGVNASIHIECGLTPLHTAPGCMRIFHACPPSGGDQQLGSRRSTASKQQAVEQALLLVLTVSTPGGAILAPLGPAPCWGKALASADVLSLAR